MHNYACTDAVSFSHVQGAALLVFGPTLLDFAEHLGVGIDVLVIMFTCRAIGGAVGSVVTGIVMDKLEQYSFTILCVIYVCCIASKYCIINYVDFENINFVVICYVCYRQCSFKVSLSMRNNSGCLLVTDL